MDKIIEKLKQKNYRITQGRINIIKIFFDQPEAHLTINQIIDILQEENTDVNVSSVYNTLKILTKEKIIEQYTFQNQKTFELNHNIHGHFICRNCEEMIDINVPGLDCLDVLIHNKYAATVEKHKIEFYGICKDCKKKLGYDEYE